MNIETAKNILLIIKAISYVSAVLCFWFFVVLPFKKVVKELEKQVDNSGGETPTLTQFSEIGKPQAGSLHMAEPAINSQSSLSEDSETLPQSEISEETAFNAPPKTNIAEWAHQQPEEASQMVKEWMQEDLAKAK